MFSVFLGNCLTNKTPKPPDTAPHPPVFFGYGFRARHIIKRRDTVFIVLLPSRFLRPDEKTPEATFVSPPHQLHHVLDMVRMGEHVHGLHGLDAIIGVEQRQVARLRGRVAAHIDDPLGCGTQDHPDDRFVDARPRAGRG